MSQSDRYWTIALIAVILTILIAGCAFAPAPVPEPKAVVVSYPLVLIAMAPEPPPVRPVAVVTHRVSPRATEPVGDILVVQRECPAMDCGMLSDVQTDEGA